MENSTAGGKNKTFRTLDAPSFQSGIKLILSKINPESKSQVTRFSLLISVLQSSTSELHPNMISPFKMFLYSIILASNVVLETSIKVTQVERHYLSFSEQLCFHKFLFKKNSPNPVCLFDFGPPAFIKSGSCPSQIHIFIKHFGKQNKGCISGEARRPGCQNFNTWHGGCSCIVLYVCTCRCIYPRSNTPLSLHRLLPSSFFAEQGKVLKVLHTSEGVFIISQYSLFHNEGPVLNMAIDSQKVWGLMVRCVAEAVPLPP